MRTVRESGIPDVTIRGADDRLRAVRSEVIDKSLTVLTIVAVPALFASLSRVVDTGWLPVMYVHLFLVVSLIAVTASRRRLGFAIRAAYLIGFCFTVGLGALFTLGPNGGASLFFVAASFFAFVMFGTRSGWFLVAVSVASVAAMFWMTRQGVIAPSVDPAAYARSYGGLAAALAGLVLMGAGIGVAALVLLRRLSESLSEEAGRNAGLVELMQARARAEQARADDNARARAIFDSTPEVIFAKDLEGRFVLVNRSFATLYGVDAEAMIGRTDFDVVGPQAAERFRAWDREVVESGVVQDCEHEIETSARGKRTFQTLRAPMRDPEGKINGVFGVSSDVTERRNIESELRTSEGRFRDFAESASDWLWEMDSELRLSFVSQRFLEIAGFAPEEQIGLRRDELTGIVPDPDIWATHLRTLRARRPFRNFVYRRRLPDGRIRHHSVSGRPVYDDDGAFLGYRGTGSDVTAFVEARERRAEAESRLARAMELSPAVFALYDGDDRLVNFNELYRQMYETPLCPIVPGVSFAQLVRAFADHVGIGGTAEEREVWVATRLDRRNAPARSYAYQRGDGEWVEVSDYPLDDGSMFTVGQIVTGRKRMEAELAQAQKMEAIGQLTGGIAHDFNNLLAVIIGNIDLLREEVGDVATVDAIDHAATRGAELTQHLLAFSRRQALQPQAVDIGQMVTGLEPLLRPALGASIRIVTDVPSDIWCIMADPGQLEGALLNLAINGRDAMPDGGTLEISFANVRLPDGDAEATEMPPGDYVRIVVRDSGVGMPESVVQHAFEPFYTTKEPGRGTGLGLSMVYGFARQSNGSATIESTPGEGTEIRLLLPRAGDVG